jgi:hypothetical protein
MEPQAECWVRSKIDLRPVGTTEILTKTYGLNSLITYFKPEFRIWILRNRKQVLRLRVRPNRKDGGSGKFGRTLRSG